MLDIYLVRTLEFIYLNGRERLILTAIENREVALRWKTRSNLDSVAVAVLRHCLYCFAAISVWRGIRCPGHNICCTDTQVGKCSRARVLGFSHLGLQDKHQKQEKQHRGKLETNSRVSDGCHELSLFLFLCQLNVHLFVLIPSVLVFICSLRE